MGELEVMMKLEVIGGLEKIEVKDETGKLEPGRVEFTPCDITLGDEVTEIEDTGAAVDRVINTDVVEDVVEPVSELDNTSTVMVDDTVLLDSTNKEDGVCSTTLELSIMLEGSEVYKTVEDCNTEEELDTVLWISSNEDKRDDGSTDVMVISAPLLDVEMVTGEVNGVSLCGNGVDDKRLVVVDVGSKTVVSDWLDFMVLVTAYDDMLVTTLPWLL